MYLLVILPFNAGNVSEIRGDDEKLAECIQLRSSFENEFDMTVSGYFQLGYIEDIPFGADSFYTVYADKYADAEASNMLSMNAEYLCERYENYTLTVLFRRGVPFVSLVMQDKKPFQDGRYFAPLV